MTVTHTDNSTLKTVAECETQALLRYVMWLDSPADKVAAECGHAIHEALALHLAGEPEHISFARFEDLYRPMGESPSALEAGVRLTWENVAEVFKAWLEDHPLAALPFTVDPGMIEVGFAEPIADDLILTGRLDALVRDPATGGLYVLDHKTTGRVNEWWLARLSLDSQFCGYMFGVQGALNAQSLKDEVVVGVFINAIELPKLSNPGRKCRMHGVDYAECRTLHPNHQIFPQTKSPEEIAQWRTSAVRLAARFGELKALYEEEGLDAALADANTNGTFNNGCYFCPFKPFCKAGRAPSVLGQFVKSEWRPWRPTEEDAS